MTAIYSGWTFRWSGLVLVGRSSHGRQASLGELVERPRRTPRVEVVHPVSGRVLDWADVLSLQEGRTWAEERIRQGGGVVEAPEQVEVTEALTSTGGGEGDPAAPPVRLRGSRRARLPLLVSERPGLTTGELAVLLECHPNRVGQLGEELGLRKVSGFRAAPFERHPNHKVQVNRWYPAEESKPVAVAPPPEEGVDGELETVRGVDRGEPAGGPGEDPRVPGEAHPGGGELGRDGGAPRGGGPEVLGGADGDRPDPVEQRAAPERVEPPAAPEAEAPDGGRARQARAASDRDPVASPLSGHAVEINSTLFARVTTQAQALHDLRDELGRAERQVEDLQAELEALYAAAGVQDRPARVRCGFTVRLLEERARGCCAAGVECRTVRLEEPIRRTGDRGPDRK